MNFINTLEYAQSLDQKDPLKVYRDKFHIPIQKDGNPFIYLCGNSLGLQPKSTQKYVQQELDDWAKFGVEGHFHAKHPWMPYHEFLTDLMAKVIGAKPIEVVCMNTLTTNLHLMMVSFYQPTKKRFKILIESDAFPSDRYAVESQIKYHGFDADEGLLELKPREGEVLVRAEDIEKMLEQHGDEIALVMIGGVNYYTGQYFDLKTITKLAHSKGCKVGFDLAHAAGNVELNLHDVNCDFAVWCTYKYLNSGPGSLGGCFVHERHAKDFSLNRFSGWWGHDKATRFNMRHDFKPIEGAEGWQLSNPPILPLAAMRASLEIFDEVGLKNLIQKSRELTKYLAFVVNEIGRDKINIITPKEQEQRGCQLSIQVKGNDKALFEKITKQGVIADWREPDVIRVAPVPLYNSFEDVFKFGKILSEAV